MKILVIGEGEHINLIKYVFPSAEVDVIDINDTVPGTVYELLFISHLDGWEEMLQNITTKKSILISNTDPEVELIETAQKYNISTITTTDGLETELKTLSKRYAKLGVATKTFESKNTVISKEVSKSLSSGIDETEIYISKFKSLIIAITGSKGGTGKSSVSINLAAAIAQNMDLKVGLIDFDLKNNGCIAHRLDLKYARTLKVFADKINAEKMPNLFVGHPAGFYVLPGLEHSGESTMITLGVVDKIIRHAASSLDVVILDLSANLDTATLRSLELANIKYIVTDAVKDSFKRLETLLSIPEVYENASLIINKVPACYKKALESQIHQLQEKYPIPVTATLRIDENEALSWANQKIPVLNVKCRFLRSDFEPILKDIQEHIVEKLPSKRSKAQSQSRGVLKNILRKA